MNKTPGKISNTKRVKQELLTARVLFKNDLSKNVYQNCSIGPGYF